VRRPSIFSHRVLTRPRGEGITAQHDPCVTLIRKEHRAQFLAHRPEQTTEGNTAVWRFILPGLLWLGACTPPIMANTVPNSAATTPIHANTVNIAAGRASYYGGRHNGRTTSSGQVFDSSKMTAAHPSLPFGTKVVVTNLQNGRSCDVEINDRGPARWTGRIIDVSQEAARCLEMFRSGVVPVTLAVAG
jgi:rare lipoprotein A